jgi:homoserine dehydrogenase
MSAVRVALLGLGTVGSGVVKTLALQEKKLSQRIGRKVKIVKVLVRDLNKKRNVQIYSGLLTTKFEDILDANPEVLIEVMGGIEPTFDYLYQAMKSGCHVVTANKELLAKHGRELIKVANHYQVHLYYEASVAGGIPILNVLRQLLQSNTICQIQGILNGTTNYIIHQMESHGRNYKEVLQEAQELGYAEADPTSDVEGYDALYKIYILAQLIYGKAPHLNQIKREGISKLTAYELNLAKELGYRIRLIASAQEKEGQLELSVEPSLISSEHPLANIVDAYNGVFLEGNIVGELLFTGKGAGELPTASAVVEDLAYLLTQPFKQQQEWNKEVEYPSHNSAVTALTQRESHFIYLESQKKDFSLLYHVLEILEKEKVFLKQVKSDNEEGEVTRIGLIVEGMTNSCIKQLEQKLKLRVKKYPILGSEEATTEEKEIVISKEKRAATQ